MYILVVFKNQTFVILLLILTVIMIICKVFYSVIGFKAMFLCLPVRYCKYTLGGREGGGTLLGNTPLTGWWKKKKGTSSNLTGHHQLLSMVISLFYSVCIQDVYQRQDVRSEGHPSLSRNTMRWTLRRPISKNTPSISIMENGNIFFLLPFWKIYRLFGWRKKK